MRNAQVACVIGAYLSKHLDKHVAVIQGPGYTEWNTGTKGFALLNDGAAWSPKAIVEEARKHLYEIPNK